MLALTEKKNNSIAINENLLNDFYSFLDVSDKTLITYKIMTTLLRLRSLWLTQGVRLPLLVYIWQQPANFLHGVNNAEFIQMLLVELKALR